jgi:hypothetical protein
LADCRGRHPGSRRSRSLRAGHGEITFGALQASLDIEYSRLSVGFTWDDSDEGDHVLGGGSADLLDEGSMEIEFAYRNGDEAVLKAKRAPFSTAC